MEMVPIQYTLPFLTLAEQIQSRAVPGFSRQKSGLHDSEDSGFSSPSPVEHS